MNTIDYFLPGKDSRWQITGFTRVSMANGQWPMANILLIVNQGIIVK